jgi:hypothetical protein
MRYIVDIPPVLVDIIQKQIGNGEYRSVQEFILNSVENQVYLLENPSEYIPQTMIEPSSEKEEQKMHKFTLQMKDIDLQTVEHDPSKHRNIMSGFWNKFFPIKITVRTLTNLIPNQNHGNEILLETLQESAATEARKIGFALVKSEKGSGRKRGDRLFTGLPVNKNIERSKSRFKSHFVGEVNSGRPDGMPATLGLISISRGEDGRNYVHLTSQGLAFSKLVNPYIDNKDRNCILSKEEQNFLLNQIIQNLPQEFYEIKFVLNAISRGKTTTEKLSKDISTLKPSFSENRIATYLSGQLNRLTDLGLIKRSYDGGSFRYKNSQKSIDLMEFEK